jgi:NAD(P)-dependent dehydrogenase (short-subunit alcohol dehydrogenase family)
MDIHDRVAIVTGGARRVGKAIALGLARAGADVLIHYNTSAGPAEETVGEIEALGRRAAAGSVDLGNPTDVGRLVTMATEALGTPSILVNSASGFAADTIADATLEGWRKTHDVTLTSPVFLTQAFAAALPPDQEGAVVNITDVRTMSPYLKHFSYVIAKGGIDTFTRAAARALGPQIRVNAVALGVVLPPPGEDDQYLLKLASRLPLKRVGGTEPVVDAVIHLVGNDFITGEIVRLDGGGHLE